MEDPVRRLQEDVWDIYHILRTHEGIRRTAKFKQACSALDAIGDTAMALGEFMSCDDSFNTGITYILAYGVLQAVFLQQDAMKHLAYSLGFPFTLPEELREIRELRNEAVGHPTQRELDRYSGAKSFHHIVRITMTKEGFELLSTYSDEESVDAKNVDLPSIIRTQTTFTGRFISELLERLKRDKIISDRVD